MDLGLLVAYLDEVHELFGKVGGCHTGAGVHMEAAKAHLLHLVDLAGKLLGVELIIPRPEGGATVFAGGVPEQRRIQCWICILLLKHFAGTPCGMWGWPYYIKCKAELQEGLEKYLRNH